MQVRMQVNNRRLFDNRSLAIRRGRQPQNLNGFHQLQSPGGFIGVVCFLSFQLFADLLQPVQLMCQFHSITVIVVLAFFEHVEGQSSLFFDYFIFEFHDLTSLFFHVIFDERDHGTCYGLHLCDSIHVLFLQFPHFLHQLTSDPFDLLINKKRELFEAQLIKRFEVVTFVLLVEIHVHTEDRFLAIHAKPEVFRYFLVNFRSFGGSLMKPH